MRCATYLKKYLAAICLASIAKTEPIFVNIIPAFLRRHTAHRPNLVRIVDNVGWLFFDKALRMGVGLLVGAWIARYLGPEQFGLLSFATAFVGLFGAVAALGLQGIVVRDIVLDPECTSETLGTAAVLQLIGGMVGFLLVLAVIAYLRPDDSLARSIVAILGSLMLLKASEVAVYWFESQVQSKYTVWVQNSVFLVFSVAKVLLLLQKAPLITFVWTMLAEAVVVAFTLLVVMGKYGQSVVKMRASIERAKELLKESWPLLLSGMFLMVQARIDQIMLGQMVGDLEVGYFSAALRIIETAAVTAMILQGSFMPSIVTAKKISEKLYRDRIEAFYKLNVIVGLSIALPLAILAPWIIHILFGANYKPAALIMAVMTIRLFLAHMGVPRGIYLLSEGLLKFSALTMVIGTVINIVLNYLFIPMYQGVGATIASLISFVITTILIDLCYSKTRANAVLMIRSIFTAFTIFRKETWVL
jgi:O-antigen/teichoic acid export membrane protein